jgi:hypothetical protein
MRKLYFGVTTGDGLLSSQGSAHRCHGQVVKSKRILVSYGLSIVTTAMVALIGTASSASSYWTKVL